MSITIATLKAAGLTAEQIVAILEVAEIDRLSRRREQNRLNQQAHRNRVSADGADGADGADKADSESALSYLLSSEVKSPKEEKKERAKRERGSVCPDDFLPSNSHFEAGLRHGLSRERVNSCCEAMKSWSKSNSHRAVARKVDWGAALSGWISREGQKTGKANGQPTLKDVFAELRAELGGEVDGGQGDPAMRDITPGSGTFG